MQRTSLGLEPDADSSRVLDAIRRTTTELVVEEAGRLLAPRMPSLLERILSSPVVGDLAHQRVITGLANVKRGVNRTVVVNGRSGKTRDPSWDGVRAL